MVFCPVGMKRKYRLRSTNRMCVRKEMKKRKKEKGEKRRLYITPHAVIYTNANINYVDTILIKNHIDWY